MAYRLFLSASLHSLLLLSSILMLAPIAYSQENEVYKECKKPFDCGVLRNLSYPFWGAGRSKYCGKEGFELICELNRYPVIVSDGPGEFRLVNVDSDSRMMTINLINPGQYVCPPYPANKTLNLSFLSQAGIDTGINLPSVALVYNCTNKENMHYPIPIDGCEGWRDSYLALDNWPDQYPWNQYPWKQCESTIKIPGPRLAIGAPGAERIATSDLQGILERQIHVTYDYGEGAIKCPGCLSSGGVCGSRMDDSHFICLCSDKDSPDVCPGSGGMGSNVSRKIIIGTVAGGTWILASIFLYFVFKRSSSIISMFSPGKRATNNKDLEKFTELLGGTLAIKRYNFSDVKKITNRFKDKLGQGGYGSVFKGKLADGRLVAVKILNASKGNVEEFINEVASISRTSHVNIVTLVGFCLEGSKRVLIYDFMPNGSLEKFTNRGSTRHLGWETLYQIAVGVARGLEYLHRGCNTRIVHFDIKPHNILLDQDFCPKISDFGLARLCNRKESIMSMWEARGTIGYIAPEVFSRHFGGVSHKSDVYSYGMMILEMVGERENDDTKTDGTSEKYFPYWIYKRLELVQEHELHAATEEVETKRNLAIVGLWCIQTNPSDRPSMSKVIEMLEGTVETLKIPPQPFLSSPVKSPPYSTSNASTA